eukprot:gnl/MRDRNA2_/MRDRNA2_32532_c0_seq1.p1 gnl/MRDRNA2_/MRDRNA2_32532_c0~~gnl/MRDRNA2_/MRDRNA2_32532_c0_seq1.p1  ORF type:complete len:518 (+),score=74.42 gnl/MRDRNA2_/MRDRNA2_32532_c0_seq1:115-1668(+)
MMFLNGEKNRTDKMDLTSSYAGNKNSGNDHSNDSRFSHSDHCNRYCTVFKGHYICRCDSAHHQRPHTPNAGITFSSGIPKYDAAYRLALSEIAQNHDKEGNFMAGKFWNEVWTRDSSYAISLATGLVDPHASLLSLKKSTAKTSFGTVWLQDQCGHFGGWPQLSDSIVGAHGAWSLFLVTGDRNFLSWAHSITKNTLARAERDVYDAKTHLFKGCASFMESNGAYPSKYAYNGILVGQTKAMSTNMLYYNGYKVAAMMGQELGAEKKEIHMFEEKAADLRQAIRSQFWNSEKGYYAYVQDENGQLFDQMEGLGESLALLAPEFESNKSRIDSIFANTYRSDKGIPCLWPPHGHTGADIYDHYHDARIWPFVQGYWALAAARHGKVDVFAEELTNLVKLSQLQNTFAEYYNMDGSFMANHVRQLWSDAGFLSMVYQGLFGMVFEPNALRFSPIKPHGMEQMISLKNVKYQGIKLDLYVEGSGARIQSFKLDGKDQIDPIVNARMLSSEGSHSIEIRLA